MTAVGSEAGARAPRELRLDEQQAALLGWAEAVRRDLPWRATRDPWSVLVAEVMLQQTQVERVVPRWRAFLDRWPDTASCASASLGDVLVEWQGLGYPRRAKWLHGAAVAIEAGRDGRFPDELDDLLGLAGVGPYTARAVLAFAFEHDVAVVDTNVGRVLARRAGRRLSPSAAQAEADALVPRGEGWAWNQGMLDLGALLCRPAEPRCAQCPFERSCVWHRSGHGDGERDDPARGSAGVSRPQAAFQGSRRQARGRLLAALAEGPVERSGAAAHVGRSPSHGVDGVPGVDPTGAAEPCDASGAAERSEWVEEVVDSLLRDGLVELDGSGRLSLPR